MELLANNGALATRRIVLPGKKSLLRNKGTRLGAKLMFFSLMFLPIAFALGIAVDSPGPLLLPFVLFVLGLARLLYGIIFGETATVEASATLPTDLFNPAAQQFSLPESYSTPVSFYDAGRPDTAEMVVPPSVTDHTTKLLD